MEYNPKILTPFKRAVIQQFPFIEEDFDALTNYGLLCKIVEYLNNLLASQNAVNAQTVALTNAFNAIKDYVDNYFDNLDVQNEINNKLDEMFESGELQATISNLVDAKIDVVENEINNLQSQINAIGDRKPIVVTSSNDMTDHDSIYILTTDSNWYYWNGSAFVSGGDYLTSGSLADIDFYAKTTNSATVTNALNIYNCSNNTALSTSTGEASSNESYWVTDFIPVDTSIVMSEYSNGHLYGTSNLKYARKQIYKQCYYDSNKEFLFANTTASPYIYTPTAKIEDYESSIAYVRLQYTQTSLAFADRDNLQIQLLGKNYSIRDKYTSSYAINGYNIGNSAITLNNFSNSVKNTIIESSMEHSINPFDTTMFSNVTIASADGVISFNSSTSFQRLSTIYAIKIPAGTEISVAEGWLMLALEYNQADTFLGRYSSDWSSSIYFPEEAYVRLTFKSVPATDLTNESSYNSLVESINVYHRVGGTPNFFYSGEKINLYNEFTATGTGLATKHQDGAIYGDTIIEVSSDGTYFVQDIQGNILQSSINLDQYETIAPHANSVCFGVEKYQNSDNFPVFYANAYNNTALPKGTCYVYRLKNDYLTTLLQTIRIGFTEDNLWTGGGVNIRPYGNFVVDTDNNKLYVYTLIDGLNVTRFFKFDLPTLNDGSSVILNTSDIEDYFDVTYMPYIQGVCYFNGKIYATAGNNGIVAKSSKLNVIDLTSKQIVSEVYLGNQFGEPETIFVKDNVLYIGQTRLYAYQF